MKKARFGPAGNSESFSRRSKSSVDAPEWLREMGLDAYEYQCGRGVKVGEETARRLGARARAAGISLSLHAPYFINLANPDPEQSAKTISHIIAACRAAHWMGAARVVLHPGSPLKHAREQAMETAKGTLRRAMAVCDDAGFGHIALCPETMGKLGQLGDLEEVLELCTLDERLVPCLDFGHLYARSLGADQGEEATVRILDRVAEVLGPARAGRFHSHFSKIEYTNGGERRHLTFDQGEYGPDFAPIGREIARRGWTPVFICESAGTQAEDAMEMKQIYEEQLRRRPGRHMENREKG